MTKSLNRVFRLSAAVLRVGMVLSSLAVAQSSSSIFAKPGPDSAMIVGAPGYEARHLYEVEFIEINGDLIGNRNAI